MPEKRTTAPLIATQRPRPDRNGTITALVSELFEPWRASCERAEGLERWYRNELKVEDVPRLPSRVRDDIKDLRDFSVTPWAKMIADSMSQDMIVDGIRQKNNGNAAPGTRLWQQNGLDARQKPLHDGVARHGKAFNLVGAAVGRLDRKRTAFIRGKSALTCDAFFRDDFDEYPDYFLEGHQVVNSDNTRGWALDFWDDGAHHWLTCELDGSKMTYIAYEPHDMQICPVVRFAPDIDLTGRVAGEIEPYITLYKRINQSTMDRLTVQRYGAFVIRWISGIDKPPTQAEADAAAIALSMTDLLMIPPGKDGNSSGRAGSLPATPLDGYIRSREADIRDLAATSHTPSFQMLGLSDNVGAEGLAAAKDAHDRKSNLWRTSLGESHEASMRLAGQAAGDDEIASDFESRVHWKNVRPHSFQSLAEGLGILADKLGIPGEVLWSRIDDWEEADTQQAKALAEQVKREEEMDAELAVQRQIEAGVGNGG